ncbi:MAG: inositol monophosphatase [Thermotogae bacterium]|nr:inositol monophosphatase [Thermotogota bacterium]
MTLKELEKDVISIAARAGKLLMKYFGRRMNVRRKGLRDIVTDADLSSEEYIKGELEKRFPEIPFFGEERGGKKAKLYWLVDPLDGTKNFARGLDIFAVSIALVEGETPIAGVIHMPTRERSVWALKGKGAYTLEGRVELNAGSPLSESFLATGFPHGNPELVPDYVRGLEAVLKKAMAIRRLGSAAWDLAMVALGMFDAFWEYGLAPWDTAAGSVIVVEAGARLSEIDGKPWNINSPTILTGKEVPYREMLEIFANVTSYKDPFR